MPKETFFNLQHEKRDKITELALEEFALHDYRSASLSRIVEKASIAKGSMYQYFDNKKDLYLYLIKISAETKFSKIDSQILDLSNNFFEQYKLMTFYGAKFDFSQPRYANLLYHATYEASDPEVLEISRELKNASYAYIRSIVRQGLKNSQLRNDISEDFLVFSLYYLTISLRDYLSQKFKFSFKEAVKKGLGSPVSDDELFLVLDEFIEFFKNGLQA